MKKEMRSNYEVQNFSDEKIPVSFHTDRLYYGERRVHSHQNIKNNKPYEIETHWHEGLEVWRIKTGNPSITIDTNQFYAKPGDVIVVNASQLHVIRVNGGECVYEVLIVDYQFCKDWGFFLQDIYFQNLIEDVIISRIFDKIADEYYSKRDYNETIIMSSCLELLGLLARNYKTGKRPIDSTSAKIYIVKQMTQFILANIYSQNILKDLSQHLRYSQFYLEHIFTEITNTTVKRYQMLMRFNYAKKMLKMDKLTIFEIAKNCGYNSATSFTVAFKKITGLTPAEYRRGKRK